MSRLRTEGPTRQSLSLASDDGAILASQIQILQEQKGTLIVGLGFRNIV